MKNRVVRIILLISLVSLQAHAAAVDDKEQRGKKLQALNELISKSSVSRQVLGSNNQAAMQKYKLAQSLHEQAVAANNEGRFEESDQLMLKAKKALFEAAKLSSTKGGAKDKEKSAFESMKRSINALLDAMQRISKEKGRSKLTDAVAEKARNQMKKADQDFAAARYKEGITLLASAMHQIDATIKEMRSGDTLTRSLSFATPKEEYEYEVERNNTHMLLVEGYAGEIPDDEEKRKKINEHLNLAKEFRKQAEEMASKERYQDAIREMESSTLNIIRAIRAMGVFIPG